MVASVASLWRSAGCWFQAGASTTLDSLNPAPVAAVRLPDTAMISTVMNS